MQRVTLQEVALGAKVTLIPQGKVYSLVKIDKSWGTLADERGRTILKSPFLSVYV